MFISARLVRAAVAWTTAAALAASLAACSGQPENGPTPDRAIPSSSQGSFGNPATDNATSSSSVPKKTPPSVSPSQGTDAQAPSQPRAVADTSAAPGSGSSSPPLRNSEANARFVTVDNPSSTSVVVNKQRPLFPLDYVPSGLEAPPVSRAASGEGALLRDDAGKALAKMFAAAAADGINLTMLSGYRSYETQVATYNSWVVRLGSVSKADNVSARPGYSEHQTGLAVDIGIASGACSFKQCFNNLPAASWVEKNAHKHGYIVRYELGYHDVTGFYAEPWHLRYIGVDNSMAMHTKGIHTLEKFFGLPAAPDY
ncbi:M15 family metallopeptidase [Arthrobacter pigmenti]